MKLKVKFVALHLRRKTAGYADTKIKSDERCFNFIISNKITTGNMHFVTLNAIFNKTLC
jgi:hypothetical protein